MPRDEELMARVREGEQSATELLFARWEARLFAFFYRLGGPPNLIEDFTEEVLVALYQRRHAYDPGRPFAPWLFGIASVVWRDYLRHRRREALHRATLEDCAVAPGHAPDPSELAEGREVMSAIRQAIGRLPDGQRIVFVLRHFEGLTYEEVSHALQLPLGTVKWRLHEAVRRLHVALAPSRSRGVTEP